VTGDDHDDGGDDDAVRASLLEELRSVDRRIAALTVEFDQIVEGAESVNTDDEHDPEGATIAFERAQVASLRDSVIRRREAIERALAGVEDGTYGRCGACGDRIAQERLEAVPGTDRCATCAAAGH
jgi:DnaK suppressor protein